MMGIRYGGGKPTGYPRLADRRIARCLDLFGAVKLGESKVPAAIKNLKRLRAKVAANPAARNPEPAFMAVVTAMSPFARYDRENDVYVFPLSALRE